MKEFFSSVWFKIVLTVGIILVILRLRDKNLLLQTKERLNKALTNDAVEDEKSNARLKRIIGYRERAAKARAKSRKRTPKEVEDTYNVKKRS